MDGALLQMAANLGFAWAAGATVGFERSFYGRAAGFRTHALVGIASAAVMLISYVEATTRGYPAGVGRIDPTRRAQGVMTGLGFLGAGVIFKEGVSVQGLTTAASIWAVAAMGMLFGLGMTLPGLLCLMAVMLTLTVMRKIEAAYPWRVYAVGIFRFRADTAPDEAALRARLSRHGVALGDVSYKLMDGGQVFEYHAMLEAGRSSALSALADAFRDEAGVMEFELARISK